MDDYPKMMYKYPSETPFYSELDGGDKFDTIIVDDIEEEVDAVSEGWFLTSPEAKEAGKVEPKTEEGWK
jgi:hypothetical protein